VNHSAIRGGEWREQGELGVHSFSPEFGDKLRVTAELSEAVYCYLVSLSPDGRIHLCFPTDENTPPPARKQLTFPEPRLEAERCHDPSGGVQAFVLLASRRQLPSYAEWRKDLPPLTWQRLQLESAIWRGNGEELLEVNPGDRTLVAVSDPRGTAPLRRVMEQLRWAPEIQVLSMVAFTVPPRRW
jgi:hypothetical protein